MHEAMTKVVRCSAALWTSTTAKEEAGKCKWEREASRASAGEVEGALWLNVAWLIRLAATHDLIASMWWPSAGVGRPLKAERSSH